MDTDQEHEDDRIMEMAKAAQEKALEMGVSSSDMFDYILKGPAWAWWPDLTGGD